MHKRLSAIFFLVFLRQLAVSQVFCITESECTFPEFVLTVGREASFQVRFDVVEFSPSNIEISGLDMLSSNSVDTFRPSIVKNLWSFAYITDTVGIELKLRYVLLDRSRINAPYVERVSSNEVRFVGREPKLRVFADGGFIPPNPNLDSFFVDSQVLYKSGKGRKSDILVERLFMEDRDSVFIVRNSHAELTEDILSSAMQYPKQYFTDRAPKATHFFIRFRVRREIPGCGVTQIF